MERAILMSAEMVVPARREDKTETRRLAGLDHINASPGSWQFIRMTGPDKRGRMVAYFKDITGSFYSTQIPCPYGAPGDVLWVRENWACGAGYDDVKPKKIDFKGQPSILRWYMADGKPPANMGRQRPSIHMPRSMCRTFLELRSVRIERLHDITEAAAAMEGVDKGHLFYDKGILKLIPKTINGTFFNGFQYIWHKLNGAESWDLNPWVWVLHFKLLTDYK